MTMSQFTPSFIPIETADAYRESAIGAARWWRDNGLALGDWKRAFMNRARIDAAELDAIDLGLAESLLAFHEQVLDAAIRAAEGDSVTPV
jgi:hypothetical protein